MRRFKNAGQRDAYAFFLETDPIRGGGEEERAHLAGYLCQGHDASSAPKDKKSMAYAIWAAGADRARRTPHEEWISVQRRVLLVGRTIVDFVHDTEDEGAYTLVLDDGARLHFSSRGDDMTYTEFTYAPG